MLPKEKEEKNIVVEFFCSSAEQRATEFSKQRKGEKFTTSEIGFPESTPVYVNEHLFAEHKALLGVRIARLKEKG
ncbi:hypothetical protein HPB50_016219 [Hyalomma asiaticum]|uniref:Uncharacterized protein n=1 Tax=Hyalomma asiaticum TaxID=266040 RepID=A0ACB7RWW1_HYAAI|nr:hypothetical protein HPB50_016219 [Hyalomma asiaticum]